MNAEQFIRDRNIKRYGVDSKQASLSLAEMDEFGRTFTADRDQEIAGRLVDMCRVRNESNLVGDVMGLVVELRGEK